MGQGAFRKFISILILALSLIGVSVFPAFSASRYQWRGTASGDWTLASNWDVNSSYPQATNGDSAVFDGSAGSQTTLTSVGSVGNIIFASDVPRSYTLTMASSATLGPGQLTTLAAILNQSNTYSHTFNCNGAYNLKGDVTGTVTFALQGDSTFSINKASDATISAAVTTGGHDATFQNTGSGTATFTGKVTGTGSVVASGAVVLNNTTSDYTGGTTVSDGASVTTNQSASGALSLSGGTMGFDSGGGTGTFWSAITVSGADNTLKTVNGAMLFNVQIADGASAGDLSIGADSGVYFNYITLYTGQTKIESGATLAPWEGFLGDKIPNSSRLSLQGGTAVFNGGTYSKPLSLLVDDENHNANDVRGGTADSPLILSGPITGSGGLTIGSGTVILSSTENTYSGGTVIADEVHLKGTVAGETPSIPMTVAGDGTISGLTWNAGGFLHLRDNNGGTFAGNLAIPSDSTLYYEGGDTGLTLSGVVSGSGPLVASSGTVRLTGNNTYSGGTQISSGATVRTRAASLPTAEGVTLSGGTLSFSDSSAGTYAGNIALATGTTSTISASEAITLSGALTGAGSLTVGSGKVTLSGTSNTYSGTTSIPSGGTFSLARTTSFPTNGNIYLEYGTLDLSGITPTNGTVSGGTLSTDTGHGTIKIPIDAQGNSTGIAFQTPFNLTGSSLNIEIVGAGGSYVTGDGASNYVVIEGVTGNANTLNLSLSGGVSVYTGQLSVSAGNLLFTLLGHSPTASSPTAVAAGQTSAQVGTHFAISNITSSIMSVVRTQATPGAAGMAGSGSPGGGAGGYGDDGPNFSFTRNPFQTPNMNAVESFNITEGGMSREVTENRERFKSLRVANTSFWAQPFGSIVRQNTMYGNLGLTAKTAGVVFGGDHKLTSELSVGGGIGYAYTDLRFDADGGKSRIKEKFATLFATWFREAFHLDMSLVGGFQRYDGYRGITSTSLRASNQHDGYQITPSLGGGYNFPLGDSKAEIFGGLSYAFSHQDKYQETGAGTANLSVKGSNSSMLRSEGGTKVAQAYKCEDGCLTIGAKLSLVNKMPIQKGKIITANAGTFQTTIKTQTYMAPGLDGKFEWDNGMSTGFSWNGEIGSKYMANEVLITFKKKLGFSR